MRRFVFAVAALVLSAGAFAAEPAKSKNAATKPAAGKTGEAKAKAGSSLAEKRAAAAEKKIADTAKRTFTKFDGDRDGKLDTKEWTRAQAALNKIAEGDALKAAGPRKDAARQALADLAKPEVQLDDGQAVTAEACEKYLRELAASAASAVASAAEAAPVIGGGDAGGRRADSGKSAAQQRREEMERRARGDRGPINPGQAIRDEAARRARDGRIGDPGNVPRANRERPGGFGGAEAGDGGRPRPNRPEGANRPNNQEKPRQAEAPRRR